MVPPPEKSLLVVDDEESITELISSALQPRGYRCARAANGAEALTRLAGEPAAFVVSDVRMPGMSGLELLEQVRAHYPDTFVILLTAYADVEIVIRALRAGACDFLTKPFRLEDLYASLQEAETKRHDLLAQRAAVKEKEERLEQLAAKYSDLTAGVLEALGAALETKHPETRAHSERVALRAANLASALGMDRDEVQAVYVAGLLHDIGKVAVDTSVLDKPGDLDSAELRQMRSHPEESARIVEPVGLSPVAVAAIRHHHERYDGTGYPDHLAGEEIPPAARILAVCDAFDAMTSTRAYQPALPPEEGFDRLRSGAGTHWDPEIVEVFCSLEQE
jgi:putative two-component system response regulator